MHAAVFTRTLTIGASILFLLSTATSVWAGERGHFRGMAVLVNTQFSQIKAPGEHPGGGLMQGEMDGLVFNDAKAKFLDKAHYQVVWKADGNGNSECLKTFTMPSGDRVFARCDGKATANGAEGNVTVVGGTGAYAGIKGKGIFKLTNTSDRVMWDVLEIDYELP